MQNHLFFLLYFSIREFMIHILSGFSVCPNTKCWIPFNLPVIKDSDITNHVSMHRLKYVEVRYGFLF